MDFKTRIANQMGALLLANLEAAQAHEEAQAVIAKQAKELATVKPPATQQQFDAAVDARDIQSGAHIPEALDAK